MGGAPEHDGIGDYTEVQMVLDILERASSSDVSKRFGYYYDAAMTHPVAVERDCAARVL